jgi:hypothetical protein
MNSVIPPSPTETHVAFEVAKAAWQRVGSIAAGVAIIFGTWGPLEEAAEAIDKLRIERIA